MNTKEFIEVVRKLSHSVGMINSLYWLENSNIENKESIYVSIRDELNEQIDYLIEDHFKNEEIEIKSGFNCE